MPIMYSVIQTGASLIIEHVITSNTTERFFGPNMAFLGANEILVLEDIKGKVWRITNGQISEEPLLDLPASTPDGLTGLLVSKHDNGSTYVFYLNEAPSKSGKDVVYYRGTRELESNTRL